MALAAGDDDVTRARQSDGEPERVAAVGHAEEAAPLSRAFDRALQSGAKGHHLEDGVERLGPRILGRQDADVGQLSRDLGHHPAFLDVAQPGRSEDGDDACIRHLPARFERPAQRIRRVREVDDGREGLAEVDALEPARHPLQRGDAGAGSLRVDAQRAGRRRKRGEDIRDHETPDERRAHLGERAEGCADREGHAAGREGRINSREVGANRPVLAVAEVTHIGDAFEEGVGIVVGVEHRALGDAGLAGGQGQAGEQPGLGVTIGLVAPVVVEMLVGDVGDHADVELAGVRAALRPTVRGGLEHAMRKPGCDHARQIAL